MKMMARKNIIMGVMTVITTATLLSPSFAILDKTRFAAHLGVAFFAFHRWVYNPYKAGSFKTGAQGRTKTLVKGGAALLFAVHELKVSSDIAHKSKSPLLQKLAGSLDSLKGEYSSLGAKLKGGQFNPADIEAANTHVSAAGAGAAAAGVAAKEKETAIPGTEDN